MKNNKPNHNKNESVHQQMIGKSAEHWQKQLWEKLIYKVASAKSPKETKKILENLISDYEKKVILRRLAVTALVGSGKTYQEIGEILWMSPQTISTAKKNLFVSSHNYKSYKYFYGGPIEYSSFSKTKNKKSFLEELFGDVDFWDLLTNPPRPPGTGIRR